MELIKTEIEGLVIIKPTVFEDSRGYFFEGYNEKKLQDKGLNLKFVQDNQSKSSYGVIRGLHYQLLPHAQTKLVRVLEGNIIDVAVDIRKGSPTFGKSCTIELSEENKLQLLVPKGFAHGFSVISETAIVFYKCDEFYQPESDRGIMYNDPDLNIDWKIKNAEAIISNKDQKHPFLKDADINFTF